MFRMMHTILTFPSFPSHLFYSPHESTYIPKQNSTCIQHFFSPAFTLHDALLSTHDEDAYTSRSPPTHRHTLLHTSTYVGVWDVVRSAVRDILVRLKVDWESLLSVGFFHRRGGDATSCMERGVLQKVHSTVHAFVSAA